MLWVFRQHKKLARILIFDFGAPGVPPKGAPKIEVHGTYPYMVSSKHPGTPTPTILCPLQKINSCFETSQMAPAWRCPTLDVISVDRECPATFSLESNFHVGLVILPTGKLFKLRRVVNHKSHGCWKWLTANETWHVEYEFMMTISNLQGHFIGHKLLRMQCSFCLFAATWSYDDYLGCHSSSYA